ncbi:MAG: hypothetical protein K9G11_00045 [Rickettsiaceae bacterium]|nr:hypothetical protein [Rickettsiaceae bacterium]
MPEILLALLYWAKSLCNMPKKTQYMAVKSKELIKTAEFFDRYFKEYVCVYLLPV